MSEGIERPWDYAPPRVRERLVPWWRGEAGAAVRRWGPVVWPGIPPVALLAWSVTSQGPHELGPAPDYVVGLYGVERERLPRIAMEASATLGREVPTGLTRDGYLADIEAQVVVGLHNYREHFDSMREKLDERVAGAMGRSTSAAWRAAAWAYSSGARRARALLNAEPTVLDRLPPAQWGGALAGFVASGDKHTTIMGEATAGKWRLAFMLLRAEQRAASAVGLGRAVLELDQIAELEAWLAPWALPGDAIGEALKELADA